MISRRIRNNILWGIVLLVSIILIITRTFWQPWLLERAEKISLFANLIGIGSDILYLFLGLVSLYKLLTNNIKNIDIPTLDASLPTTNVDKILHIDQYNNQKLLTWIDRQLISTKELRENRYIVIAGPMKSGKTREAAELIREALRIGMVESNHIYDLTEAIRMVMFTPDSVPTLLDRKLVPQGRVLFYIDELPAYPTPNFFKTLEEYLRALRKCDLSYFVTTVRSDHLANNPGTQKWLNDTKIKIIELRQLNEYEKSHVIDELFNDFPEDWRENIRPELIQLTDGTPYHLDLISKHIGNPASKEEFIITAIELAKKKLSEIWVDIRASTQGVEPAASSLLKALSVFYHSSVFPFSGLVFSLAENMEKQNGSFSMNPNDIPSRVKRAAKIFRYYGITYNDIFNFPDVAVESLVNHDDAFGLLEDFLFNTSFSGKNKLIHMQEEALFELGTSYSFREENHKAIKIFQWITSSNPHNVMAWSNLGLLFGKLDRLLEADVALRKAVEIGSQSAFAWSNLGILLKKEGKISDAEAALRKAIEKDPNGAFAWINLGNLLFDQKRMEEAEEAYRKALDLDQSIAFAWSNLGVLLVEQERIEEAEITHRKAVEIDPRNPSSWYNLGLLFKKQGRKEEEEKAYRNTVELDPKNSSAWYNLGVLLKDHCRKEEAESAYKKAVEADPKNAPAWFNLSLLLKEQGRKEEAEETTRKAVEADPNKVDAWSNLGVYLIERGRKEEAEEIWKNVVIIDPKQAEAWSNLGGLFHEEGKEEEAEKACRKAIEINPRTTNAWSNLGNILNVHRKKDEAEKAYRNAIEADPKNVDAWNNLGVLLNFLGRIEEAEKAYREAVENEPNKMEAWYNLGILLSKQGRKEEAVESYKKVVEINPLDSDAWFFLGVLLIEIGRKEEAEEALKKSVEIDPKRAEAWYDLGTIFRVEKRYKDAKDALETAITYKTDNANYHSSLGKVYRILGQSKKADREISKARKLSKNENSYNRACISVLCGETPTALALLKEAIANNETTVEWVREDPDWEELREDPEFKRILENAERAERRKE